jgi:hypothetical protein
MIEFKLIIPNDRMVTITPAPTTPNDTRGRAFLKGMPKRKAHKEPVQAPVKGRGMATKITKAKSLHFSNVFSCFFLVLVKSQLKNLFIEGLFSDK